MTTKSKKQHPMAGKFLKPNGDILPWTKARAREAMTDLQVVLNNAWDVEPELLQDLGISEEVFSAVIEWKQGDRVLDREENPKFHLAEAATELAVTNKNEQAKHTPGPWHANTPADDRYAANSNIRDVNGNVVAISTMPSIANAKLIAAAPELAAALKEILDEWESRGAAGSDIDRGRTALAKAGL